jgi:PAS domain S-box-containing protein
LNWIVGRVGWILPWLVFLLVITGTAIIDGQLRNQQQAERDGLDARAQEQVGLLATAVGNVLAERMGALAVPKLRLQPDPDAVPSRAFTAAVDSITRTMDGLQSISLLHTDGDLTRGADALLGRPGLDPLVDTVVKRPFLEAVRTTRPTASGLVRSQGSVRVILFDPVPNADSSATAAILAAEIDPQIVYRLALTQVNEMRSQTLPGIYGLHGPDNARISAATPPVEWPAVERPLQVGNAEWRAVFSYPPPPTSSWSRLRVAAWIPGFAVALALATVLAVLRQTIRRQRDEIALREEAEQRVRAAAEESRELSMQLSAAHSAAQRLSTSLDPQYVLEFFLGSVAEELQADTASLYTFDDEGDLRGRSRLVLRDAGPETERLKGEDIRQVRVPAALMPKRFEAASTGEVQVVEDASELRDAHGLPVGVETAAGWVTIPLKVAGNMVGVAIWEVFGEPHRFDSKDVAFAEALGAQAAAVLRSAELYASLEALTARATAEADRFGAVLDQMADGVVIADERGRLERFNTAAGELLGARPASGDVVDWIRQLDIAGEDRRPMPPEDFPVMRALRGERVRRVNVISRTAGRGERHLSASATPIVSESGEASGAAMVVRDTTDEQQYAELLRHTNQELRKHAALLEETNQQLRTATAAKDQFLAVVSHELRTPVNAIMGYAQLMDLEIKGPLNVDQKGMLRRLRATAWHLLRLIDEILDLPRLASGQVELRIERVEVDEVIRTAVDQVFPIAEAKGLTLHVVQGAVRADRLCAYVDRTRLTQVVLNLLSNAVKFTDQGHITVSSDEAEDGFVEVAVRDTGVGIPEDQLEKIFEEFYQVEGGLTRKAGGTGLGLAITRRFVRLMGGDVTVHSRLGEGAEFIVRVPAARAAEEARSA